MPANDLRAVANGPEGAWVVSAAVLSLITPEDKVIACPLTDAGELCDVLVTLGNCRLATSTGVYRYAQGKFTRILTCNARRLVDDAGGEVWVVTDRELVRLRDGKRWPLPDTQGNVTAVTARDGCVFFATALGFWLFDGKDWSEIPLPAESDASHVSALGSNEFLLLVGLYGDGLYSLEGAKWTRMDGPESFKRNTAITADADRRLIGTQEDGLWESVGKGWKGRKMPPAIPSTDIYGITAYKGTLWAATFDRGLLCRKRDAWRRVDRRSGLSSDSPRDLLVFGNRLYVRYSTDEVDCFDGHAWRPAFDKTVLPRQGVYAMATDGHRLYLGVWAGWAVTDGKTWEHHFKEPALQNQVITAIAAGGATLWLGTQKAGLFAWRDGQLKQYHESHGLTDDWITRISINGDRVLVGTYNGGLLQWDGNRFAQLVNAGGFAIRDIAFTKDGKALTATPLGVYREEGTEWRPLDPRVCGGLETQVLYPIPGGVWIGTRTALAYLPLVE